MNALRMTRPLPHRQRGAVMVLVVVALATMLLMGALALDGSHMLVNKTRLQNAVDAAALSGAKTLQQVTGSGNAGSLTQDAARETFRRNAEAAGNGELAGALGDDLGSILRVDLSASVYGPFSFPGPADARYVRVSVAELPLAGFLWGILQAFGNDTNKAVAAIATAGPSPTSPCNIAPLMVCGNPGQHDPDAGMFWGYRFGDLEVLKGAAGNSPAIGPGNFQLIRLGDSAGGADVREALAGGIEQCNSVGKAVETEPGNTVGPVSQGFNTRFGQYAGALSNSAGEYPPDLVTDYSSPAISYNNATAQAEYQGQAVSSNAGNLSTASAALLDYNDWRQRVADCPNGCRADGVFERRMLKIVLGDCSGSSGGQTSVPVLGFGCFFLVQPLPTGTGNEAQIFGQFVSECEGDNVPDSDPVNDGGPQIIQLFKTYIDNNRTPSSDS
ncbi:pilus assembly protein [Stutzerimonas stutzeri]|uniref:Pilus assembly protein n=1 Tax=Stutzerimonas stutzeri TaxID=316 RepID=A0A2N8SXG2_STUST|nr:Tad domain-containing protein [Stutzerimonas stutzeri]MCQ4326047.1 Tad domain-containing protein [Stutzerimonas stutzeri]PNG07176.1 pilus assembly protein [Stutzerimonas stutzeri]